MNINISDEARKYIKEKTDDNSVTLFINRIKTGWNVFHEPAVRLGKTEESKFELHEVNGIKVYVSTRLKTRGIVNIKLKRFLWMKSLKVDGLKF